MADVRSQRTPKSALHVNFEEKGEMRERKEKFLTAKYGAHQMSLIRKRLGVEMWMYDELHKLYECKDDMDSHEVEIDLDELLDMESDQVRIEFLQKLLSDAKKPKDDVQKFIKELMERSKTL